MTEIENAPEPSGVSRRTVTKAMAWAVPAIAIATPVPASAASPCTPVISFGGRSCKCPGQSTNDPWGFRLQFCATLAPGCTVTPGSTIEITGVFSNTGGPAGTPLTPGPGVNFPISVPIGGCTELRSLFFGTNSGNFLFVTYTVNDGPTQISPNIPSPPDCDDLVPPDPCAA